MLVTVTKYPYPELAHETKRQFDLHEMRLGKLSVTGDARQFTMGKLASGEVVAVLHKDQTKEAVKEIRRRLKGVWANTGWGVTRLPEAWKWEGSVPESQILDEAVGAR